jgi:competence protein ComFC
MNIFKLKEWLLDLVFPKECLACGCPDVYLCGSCLKKIELNLKSYCALCKADTDNFKICPSCREKTALQAVFVVANYNNKILQAVLHNLKYNYVQELSQPLIFLMQKFFQRNNLLEFYGFNKTNTLLVPVPLHKKRYLSRGFNQSVLLADGFSPFFNIPRSDLLKRQVNTVSQVTLKRHERQENMKDAFVYVGSDMDKNKKIIIIDDVVTTGSTLIECASALRRQGFKDIYGLVIAQRDD